MLAFHIVYTSDKKSYAFSDIKKITSLLSTIYAILFPKVISLRWIGPTNFGKFPSFLLFFCVKTKEIFFTAISYASFKVNPKISALGPQASRKLIEIPLKIFPCPSGSELGKV